MLSERRISPPPHRVNVVDEVLGQVRVEALDAHAGSSHSPTRARTSVIGPEERGP